MIFVHLTLNLVKFWKKLVMFISYVLVCRLCGSREHKWIPICLIAEFLSIASNDLLSIIMTLTVITMLWY